MSTSGQEVRVRLLLRITSTKSITSLLKSFGKNWSSEVVSLFSEDWELGRMASSCHMAMDLFMPRKEGCVLGELKVVGLTSVAVFIVPEGRRNVSDRPF